MHATQLQVGDVLAPDDEITVVRTHQEEDLLGPLTIVTVTTAAGRTLTYTGDPWINVRRGTRSC